MADLNLTDRVQNLLTDMERPDSLPLFQASMNFNQGRPSFNASSPLMDMMPSRDTIGSGVMSDQDVERIAPYIPDIAEVLKMMQETLAPNTRIEKRVNNLRKLERIKNIPQLQPLLDGFSEKVLGAGVMTEQDAQRVKAALGVNNRFGRLFEDNGNFFREMRIGDEVMYKGDNQVMSQDVFQDANPNARPLVVSEGTRGVMSDNDTVRINKALLSGVQDPMMSNVDTSVMQPLVDLGFEQQVRTIMTYPQNSPESMQAQQEILSEMGTGMDVDAFVQTVKEVAPKEIQEEILKDRMMPVSGEGDEGIMALMSAGRNEDTTVGHLAEGDVVVPPEVLEANPSIIDELEDTMLNMGVDPRSRIVDTTGELGGIASINPETGLQEFFIKKALSKLNRARKKVTKALAPVVATVAPFIPGVGPLAKAAITAAAGKASGLSTKDALLGGALSYGGSKLFASNPLNPAAGTVPKGNIFSRIGEYVMPGKDGISLLGNLGKSASGAYEYIMPGKDNVGLFGNVKSGISGLFNRTPESDIIKYDPVNQGYINIETGMPATASEIASLTTQSNLGRFEDVAKMLTGDDGLTRTQELQLAGYTPEQIKQAKANGTFNALVSQARAEGKVPGRGAVGAIQGALTGGTQTGGDQGGLGMMGKLGIAGLAGLIGKLAYEEAKDQKGVPLTPLTQMDPLGRYNIEAEIARRTGAEMPSRVEFGLNPEGMPALSGGKPRNARYGGIMAFADGGVVAMAEGGDMDVAINVEEFPVRDGQINGAGTETSDDIPAMLSDGEFVMTAKAVRGAGSFDVSNNNGILTLTPNGEPTRESGTRVMYKLMEHFGSMA